MKKGTFTRQNIAYNKFKIFMKHTSWKNVKLWENVNCLHKSNNFGNLIFYLFISSKSLRSRWISSNFYQINQLYILFYIKKWEIGELFPTNLEGVT